MFHPEVRFACPNGPCDPWARPGEGLSIPGLLDFYADPVSDFLIACIVVGVPVFFYCYFRKSTIFRYFKAAISLLSCLLVIVFIGFYTYWEISIEHPYVSNFLVLAIVLAIPIWISTIVEIRSLKAALSGNYKATGLLSLLSFVLLNFYTVVFFTILFRQDVL
ncbi:MAG: hypothetical protein HY242_06655 [Afipia sp.]|nr:hypothetical protein [Afipia sp.]